jgi:ABC-2 type transport system permease protein
VIGAVVRKELTQYRRDGRVLGIGSLIACLVLLSVITGWSTYTVQRHESQQAQQEDRRTFVSQGEKPPHSAAHFGRMAYKPVPPLAVFDVGALPYLGQVIWLEAHRQDPAMFRPAEDSPELRRLADLSVAGILTMLLPLLIFVLGYGAFAGEREGGTLRQIMSSGADLDRLFIGKLVTIAGVAICVAWISIAVSTAVALLSSEQIPAADTILRAVGLAVTYALFCFAFAAVVLTVSARARSATSAMLVLMSVWAVCIVIVPRIAASLGEQIYPTPDSGIFWTQTVEALRAGRPKRDSEEYRAIEQEVLTRALGHQVTAPEAETLRLNRNGLSLQIGELLDATVYAEAYRTLYQRYEQQQHMRRIVSVFSPAIALQHASSALAATDTSAHRHFALEAERQRREIIRRMNEDMMLNGAGQGFGYRASADFWETVPDFIYDPPAASFGFRSALPDLLLLAVWSVVAIWIARMSAVRLSPLA